MLTGLVCQLSVHKLIEDKLGSYQEALVAMRSLHFCLIVFGSEKELGHVRVRLERQIGWSSRPVQITQLDQDWSSVMFAASYFSFK